MDSSSARKSQILIAIVLLIWISGLVSAFYIFHKPLSATAMERAVQALVDLLAAMVIAGVAGGLGWRLSAWSAREGLERFALSGALGLGALGLLMLALSALGLATNATVLLLLGALAILTFCDILPWARSFRTGWKLEGGFAWVCLAFCAFSILLALGTALAPPVAWDALVYHLRIPQEILSTGSLSFSGDSLFQQMPLQAEMVFTAALALTGRGETAAVVGWWAGALALLGITGTASRMGMRYPILAAAILLAGDTFARELGWAYVDWFAALFGWAAIATLSGGTLNGRRLFLAGLCAGFAASTKYSAASLLAVLILWLFFQRAGWKIRLHHALIACAGFAIVCVPWALKNIPLCGVPWVCVPDWRLRFFSGMPMPGAFWILWIAPVLQTVAGTYGTPLFGMTIGPLLLAFLPGAWFRRGEESVFPFGLLWLCGGMYWAITGAGAIFSTTIAQPRLFVALLLPVALLSAHGFDGFFRFRLGQIRVGIIASLFALLTMGVQAIGFSAAWISAGVPAYLAGAMDRTAYRETNTGWYTPAMERLHTEPAGSKVRMLWEPRGYECGSVCLEDASIDEWFGRMRAGENAERAISVWRRAGITHILINDAGATFERNGRPEYAASDWTELDRLRRLLIIETNFGSAYTLYRLPPG
jgi:hypothetical protein